MLALGLQGSPRKKGNTDFLLTAFMDELAALGAQTRIIDVCNTHIEPCKEYVVCEKKGFCPIKDQMRDEIYPLLRQAQIVVVASPVFFYNVTAQLKALIDRSQTLWARKYRLKLKDPAASIRRGFILGVGATSGKQLFDGVHLTAKYFFDAIDAEYAGHLTYNGIEHKGDMQAHPSVRQDIKKAAAGLMAPLDKRPVVLFACRENACRSQMAGALAQFKAADKLNVLTAGSQAGAEINPLMIEVMREKGIDMAFRRPQSLDAVLAQHQPAMIITMGCGEQCPLVPGAKRLDWELPDPAGQPIAFMRQVRDDIEKRVDALIQAL